MSGMNALSGITILAVMTATAAMQLQQAARFLAVGIICATINVVAGFGLTDRMLKMFKTGNESKEDTK